MKTLYLDCGMGAAGDMLTAALLELLPEPDAFLAELNGLGIPGVQFIREQTMKCGITGTHISVKVDGEEEDEYLHDHQHHEHEHEHGHSHGDGPPHHHHSGMRDIEQIVAALRLPAKVERDVLAVYGLIAKAESKAHNVPVTEIHFHAGSGHVHCAHGILPVPAPATAFILKDAPIYGGGVKGELCTPTGAALLKHFATEFGEMPVMRVSTIGYGMGKKDFKTANCVRALWGETEERNDAVLELSCNVDDMTGEEMGFAMERLFDAGALEVYTVPIGMKKNRPGTLLQVLCRETEQEALVRAIFQYTSTIGVRETVCRRYVLDRRVETLETPYGKVHRKNSVGYGISRAKYEYDDLAEIAKAQGISLTEARALVEGC